MRVDVAPILIGMGFVAGVDFEAYQASPTDVQVTWRSASPQPTAAEIDAAFTANPNIYADKLEADRRTVATANVDGGITPLDKVDRAVAAVLADEINILRSWTRSFKTEVAAATSLANLQARVATLPTLTDRTLVQARTAIKDKIIGGAV